MFKFLSTMKVFSVSVFLISCSSDPGVKYIFNQEDHDDNIEQYTLSKGESDVFGCLTSGIVFTKEFMGAIRDGKESDFANAAKFSPTVINVYKDKIEWTDLGQETVIKDGSTKLTFATDDPEVTIDLIVDGEVLYLGYKVDGLHCKMPFSKVS